MKIGDLRPSFGPENFQPKEEVDKYIEQMYLEHHGPIYRFALSKTRDSAKAEDVVQSVFERLAKHLQHHNPSEIKDFIAYAIRTAQHVLSDIGQEEIRSGKSNALSLEDDLNVGIRNSVVDERATRAITEHIEIEDRFIKSMADATPRQKEMIARWREGLSRQEIADDMGLDENIVKVEINRVLAKVRHRLRPEH